jgi:hypothetical protein
MAPAREPGHHYLQILVCVFVRDLVGWNVLAIVQIIIEVS